jgi:hypothetical protein
MSRQPWYQPRIWAGMSLGGWLRLLARNRFAVSPSRIPLALVVTLCSLGNSGLKWLQWLLLGRRVARVEVPDDPLFIVGHWRTGTTMLHEVLALDDRHRAPTTYECLCPNHFLLSESLARRWLRMLVPKKRPFDNVRMSLDRPQEDESALANRGLPSTFLTVAFPNRPLQDRQYFDLEGLSPGKLQRWRQGLLQFYRELLCRRRGRLVLKSPQHTFRIPVLLEMFPRARFVYLVRDPFVVFSSTVHFWRTMYLGQGLQRTDLAGLEEFVFDTFVRMHARFEQTRGQIPAGQFWEMRYEELVADPVGQVRTMYEQLGLGDFEPVRGAMEHYAKRSENYQTNRYEELDPQLRDEISRRWAAYIEQYGYSAPQVCRSAATVQPG